MRESIGTFLVILGLALVTLGLLLPLAGKLWPSRLPGDVHLTGDGWSVHVLLGTSILLSVVLTLLLNLILWLINR